MTEIGKLVLKPLRKRKVRQNRLFIAESERTFVGNQQGIAQFPVFIAEKRAHFIRRLQIMVASGKCQQMLTGKFFLGSVRNHSPVAAGILSLEIVNIISRDQFDGKLFCQSNGLLIELVIKRSVMALQFQIEALSENLLIVGGKCFSLINGPGKKRPAYSA